MVRTFLLQTLILPLSLPPAVKGRLNYVSLDSLMGMINMQYEEEENYLQHESLLGILSISGVRKAEVEARKKAFLENANNLMVLC